MGNQQTNNNIEAIISKISFELVSKGILDKNEINRILIIVNFCKAEINVVVSLCN